MEKFITKSTIISQRGWTDSIFNKFLPVADKTVPNPYYKCAAPMKLYKEERVARIESEIEFKEALAKCLKRKQGAKKSVKTKEDKIIDYVNGLEITIPLLSKKELDNNARSAYDEFQMHKAEMRGDYFNPEYSCFYSHDDKFIKRITINYLRHECTDYDAILEKMYGKVGVQVGHNILQKKINDKILETYPHLR